MPDPKKDGPAPLPEPRFGDKADDRNRDIPPDPTADAVAQVKPAPGGLKALPADEPPPAQFSGSRVPGSETVEGGKFWVGNRLVNCDGETLGIYQPPAAR